MFTNLSARKKLLGLVGIALTAIVITCLLGNIGLYSSKESIQTIYEDRMIPIKNLNTISNLLLEDQNLLKSAIVDAKVNGSATDSESLIKYINSLQKNISSSDELWKSYVASTLTPEEKVIANQFSENYSKLLNTVIKPAMVYNQGNNVNEAIKLSSHISELVSDANANINGLVKTQFDLSLEEYKASVNRFQRALMISLLVFLVSFAALA